MRTALRSGREDLTPSHRRSEGGRTTPLRCGSRRSSQRCRPGIVGHILSYVNRLQMWRFPPEVSASESPRIHTWPRQRLGLRPVTMKVTTFCGSIRFTCSQHIIKSSRRLATLCLTIL